MKREWRLNVCIPDHGLFPWESQVVQYPEVGPPGIDYFKGDIGEGQWVDCLLYRDADGRVVGILNHYPFETPWEKVGNVNIWIHPERQRQGVGSALVLEAMSRYGIDFEQQRYTYAGARLACKIIEKYEMRDAVSDDGAAMFPVKRGESHGGGAVMRPSSSQVRPPRMSRLDGGDHRPAGPLASSDE